MLNKLESSNTCDFNCTLSGFITSGIPLAHIVIAMLRAVGQTINAVVQGCLVVCIVRFDDGYGLFR